eukprot:scaffold3234_cov166-Amphora_coffeaeformis.AAC.12
MKKCSKIAKISDTIAHEEWPKLISCHSHRNNTTTLEMPLFLHTRTGEPTEKVRLRSHRIASSPAVLGFSTY